MDRHDEHRQLVKFLINEFFSKNKNKRLHNIRIYRLHRLELYNISVLFDWFTYQLSHLCSQNHYQLQFGVYTGNAGDALSGSYHPEVQWWASHQGMKFSTRDMDNDRYERSCAQEDKGGWWFNRFATYNSDSFSHLQLQHRSF